MGEIQKDADEGLGELKLLEVEDDNNELSYEGKVKMLESDVETLYKFAISKGLSSSEIRSSLVPFLGEKTSLPKRIIKDSFVQVLVLSSLIAAFAIGVQFPPTRSWIHAHLKLVSLKTSEYIDWTPYFTRECFIRNPFQENPSEPAKKNCTPCINFTDVLTLTDADPDVVSQSLLSAIPFVVTDATRTWKRHANGTLKFSLDRMKSFFNNPERKFIVEIINETCPFRTSAIENFETFIGVLVNDTLPDKFHVSWANCKSDIAKIFRLMAKRPYFIPPFTQASPHNEVVVAKGIFQEEEFDFAHRQGENSASWLIVVQGVMKITLKPPEECLLLNCTDHSFSVGEGHAVVVPGHLWSMFYSPMSEGFTFGVASVFQWD